MRDEQAKSMMKPRTQPKDLLRTWLEQRALDCQLAVALIYALSDRDHGDEDRATDVSTKYYRNLMTADKGDAAGLDDETKVMLGAWLATDALTQR